MAGIAADRRGWAWQGTQRQERNGQRGIGATGLGKASQGSIGKAGLATGSTALARQGSSGLPWPALPSKAAQRLGRNGEHGIAKHRPGRKGEQRTVKQGIGPASIAVAGPASGGLHSEAKAGQDWQVPQRIDEHGRGEAGEDRMIYPGRSFLIAGFVAWAGLGAAAITGSREPAPAVGMAVAIEQPLLKKSDRLIVRVAEPVPVKTERVLPPEPVAPVEIKKKPVVEAEHHKERHIEHDICTRHGMRKVWIVRRHWKSWRCR